MRKRTTLFLILALVTGLVGFSGFNFSGIEVIRVFFLIFADLLVISILARLFFPAPKMKLQRIRK